MSNYQYLDPVVSPETRPFWEAANEGQLAMQVCKSCGRGHHYPRSLCPHCHSEELQWTRTDGRGIIYSFTVVSRGKNEPYVLAYVEIAPGVRVLTHIVDCDPAGLVIGGSVRAVFRPAPAGQNVLLFTPAGDATGEEK